MADNRADDNESNLEAVYDIPLHVAAVLGTAKVKVSELLQYTRGSVVELDKNVGDPVDIYINNRLVAKGEIVLIENKLGITLTELLTKED